MSTTNFHIGLAIKVLADKKKLSAEIIAQRLGIVRQSVYDTYERETVRKSTVTKYAKALGVTEDEVYQLAGFKPESNKSEKLDTFNEGDGYLMRRLNDLEEMVKFLKDQLSEKDNTIRTLLGKSDSVPLAKFAATVFFMLLNANLGTLQSYGL